MKTLENCLIIIGSTLPHSFPADYIKQTAKILSKKNHVIVFLWGNSLSIKEIIKKVFLEKKEFRIIKKKDKIILFNPIHFVPFRRFNFIRQVNLLLNVILLNFYLKSKGLSGLKKILWVFNYELYNLPKIVGKSYLSFYDCVEYPSSLDKETDKRIKNKEKKLIQNVNLFFVNSYALKKIFKQYSPIVVPQGFALETFKKFNNKDERISLKLTKKRPIIGYVGGINYRLDFKLLLNLTKNHPQWSFVFVGQRQKQEAEDKFINTDYWLNKLLRLENVSRIKNQPKPRLPQIISQFDICLIPYNISLKFNRYCYPMKVFEYFYIGKPVITTPIEELKKLKPLVKIANESKEFEKQIKKILKTSWPDKYIKKQKQLAVANSWQAKIEKISQVITPLISKSDLHC